jgi:sec-independent protein translocase protein TatB
MLNLDPGKLLVIGVVAIILLGPDRLPQVARQIGGAWRTFNEFRHRMESEVRNTMPDLPATSEIARLARSPSALLNHLSNMASDEEPDGSYQPPNLNGENGTVAQVDDVAPATSEADGDTAPQALAQQEPAPTAAEAPAPRATPAPIDVARPPRAPQPSGVVVPGDPTLN